MGSEGHSEPECVFPGQLESLGTELLKSVRLWLKRKLEDLR